LIGAYLKLKKEMNNMLKYLTMVVFFIVLYSCEKDFDTDGRFIGSWEILSPDSDTITFKDESSFSRKFHDGIDHSFNYSYDKDSITIQYAGPNLILVQPTTHHYELKNNVLLVDFSNGCYGFDTKIYNLTKIE
jgi:hypothetical protein